MIPTGAASRSTEKLDTTAGSGCWVARSYATTGATAAVGKQTCRIIQAEI